jgi:hypothetical protein
MAQVHHRDCRHRHPCCAALPPPPLPIASRHTAGIDIGIVAGAGLLAGAAALPTVALGPVGRVYQVGDLLLRRTSLLLLPDVTGPQREPVLVFRPTQSALPVRRSRPHLGDPDHDVAPAAAPDRDGDVLEPAAGWWPQPVGLEILRQTVSSESVRPQCSYAAVLEQPFGRLCAKAGSGRRRSRPCR